MLNSGEQPTGIIKCMPHKFVFDEYGAVRFIQDFFYKPNRDPNNVFYLTLSAIPKFDVLHLYLLVDKCIRFRANIVEFRGPATYKFSSTRTITGKAWVVVGAPVIRAPFKIEMRGFQGFRYTSTLF